MASRLKVDNLTIWRMTKHEDLSGRGGLAVSGRWHTRPKPIVYCGDSPHTAYREILRHFDEPFLIPEDYVVLEVHCRYPVEIDMIAIDELRDHWDSDIFGWSICQPIGDDWLLRGRTSVLGVPSVARPGSYNYLINPVHRMADEFAIVGVTRQPFPKTVVAPA